MATSKISRRQLKAIVKECLIEILQEGLGADIASETVSEVRQRPVQQRRQVSQTSEPQQQDPSASLMEAAKRAAGGSSIMAELLADTAATTLQTMIAHGDGEAYPAAGAPAAGALEQFRGTPEDLFGTDMTSKWADLAFAAAPSKKPT